MAPFDQSRQFLYDLPGEKRRSGYVGWLDLRGDSGVDGLEERDGGDGNGKHHDRDRVPNTKNKSDNSGNGGNKNNNNKNDNGRKNKDNNDPNPDSFSSSDATPVPPPETTTLLPSTAEPTTTALAELQPAFQPAVEASPTPVVVLNPDASTTPFEMPTMTDTPPEPTTAEASPPLSTTSTTTTDLPPDPTTSTTPIVFVPSMTSAISMPSSMPMVVMTEMPQMLTFASASTSTSTPISDLVTTMTMSASAVVTSITATTTEIVVLTTASSQRKGEKDPPHHKDSNATTTAAALSDNSSGDGTFLPSGNDQHEPPLTPTAEHVLLAAGIIGAFILTGFLGYLFVRIRKIPTGEMFDNFLDNHPRLERILSVIPAVRKRNQWSRRLSSSLESDNNRNSRAYDSSVPEQKSMDAYYAPASDEKSKTSTTSKHESGDASMSEKASISYGMATNPNAPLTVTNPSSTMSFYNVQQPGTAYLPNLARMSELSSLSSGFGDAQIDVPESGPTNGTYNSTLNSSSTLNSNAATNNTLQPYRQSFMQRASRAFAEPLTSRFSWTTANQQEPPAAGQRDTMYTTTSEDSAPRFRTIHSWVNQQTSRVERGRTEHVPSMPPLPPSQRHLKRGSEEPAFRHHPGEEVNIPASTRIESAILDKKLGAGV